MGSWQLAAAAGDGYQNMSVGEMYSGEGHAQASPKPLLCPVQYLLSCTNVLAIAQDPHATVSCCPSCLSLLHVVVGNTILSAPFKRSGQEGETDLHGKE